MESGALALNRADVSGARALGRFLDAELDPLALPKRLEHPVPYSALMEKMLDAGLIADEAETLVGQETHDRAAGHGNPPLLEPVRCSVSE